jgi:hypothetical protein
MKETPRLKRILLRCSRGASRLWRNNVGAYKTDAGHWIRYGVCNPGGSDLLGFRTIEIKPEHVGKRIAQFVAFEVKQPGEDPTEEQLKFGKIVNKNGGLFAVVHDEEEAEIIMLGAAVE